MDDAFVTRYLNDGFSGGEKKRAEILQMALLQPEIAILDETDSGLDIDALRTVSEGVNALRGPDLGVLVITHYQRILNYIKPDFVHVLVDGRIVRTGGRELVELSCEVRGLRPDHQGGGAAMATTPVDVGHRRVQVRLPRRGGLRLQERAGPDRPRSSRRSAG